MHIIQPDFTKSIKKNIKIIQEHLHNSDELVARHIYIEGLDNQMYYWVLLYISGIVNTQVIRDSIIESLLRIRKIERETFLKTIAFHYIRSESVEEVTSVDISIEAIVSGKTIVLIDGFDSGILVDTIEWQQRPIEQSTRQCNVQGPMIAYSEQLKGNLNWLHKMIKSPNLMVEKKQIRSSAKTDLSIVYITDRVDQTALEEVRQRIDSLHIEYVLESRIIEEAIEGKQKTIFPLTFITELPDQVAAALYEGRIGIIVDGTPSATIVPNVFIQYMQQPSDYYLKSLKYSSRLLTFISFFISMLLPGIYLAVAKFHENWLPKEFAKKYFTHSHTILPFWLEVFFLVFILHILSIGSYRISKESVILVSLISTMTISSTAVDTKLIHPLSLIIVGVSYLLNTMLTVGTLSGSIISLRYAFLFIGNYFGFTGILIGMLIVIIHMARLRSVGVPYLAPFIPFNFQEFKDVFYRGDIRKLTNSPHTYPHDDKDENK